MSIHVEIIKEISKKEYKYALQDMSGTDHCLSKDDLFNLGETIANVFSLTKQKNQKYETSWGYKTEIGLARTLISLYEDAILDSKEYA